MDSIRKGLSSPYTTRNGCTGQNVSPQFGCTGLDVPPQSGGQDQRQIAEECGNGYNLIEGERGDRQQGRYVLAELKHITSLC